MGCGEVVRYTKREEVAISEGFMKCSKHTSRSQLGMIQSFTDVLQQAVTGTIFDNTTPMLPVLSYLCCRLS